MHSFGPHQRGREGGSDVRATQFLHTIAQACALERLLQCRCISDRPTRETTVTSYKSWAHWRKLGRYGLFPTVGGAITPHWSAIARLKLGSPRPIRCLSACFHGCLRLRTKSEEQTVNPAPGKTKQRNKNKEPALRLATWNVRTMCPGLSHVLQQVDDARKTAIINDELKRLKIDIAALQEARLASNGCIREIDYTFFW